MRLARDERPVGKVGHWDDIIEIEILNSKGLLCVVNQIVEICNGNLDMPITLVVELCMPVYSTRASGCFWISLPHQASVDI